MKKINRKAIIFGIKGYKLTNSEIKLFKKEKPWGLILFSRNIKNINQLKKLISNIKVIFKDKNYPILIDQEGGKVSRLNAILDFTIFSQDFFYKLYIKNKKLFYKSYKIYVDTVCNIFKEVGININTVPVLDIRRKNSHNVIGNRSYSRNFKRVIKLGNICIDLYNKNKVATVAKHVPGHGLAKSDSHYNTPIVTAKKEKLISKDFKVFKKSKSLFFMTAHVVYTSFDKINTATHSKGIISKIIRGYINFKGLIISDDISMKSLKLDLLTNAKNALSAGCNLVLHCNGDIKEMRNLAKVIPLIDRFTQKKTTYFYNFLI